MSRSKRVAIAAVVVVAGSLFASGVASASDYTDHDHVDVAGLNVGGLVHTVLHIVGDVL
ncbi:MAG TPA: hypothetical protein VH008_35440 [Pseudonocardia sp.]|nr:hypothetical protein [Pseudonocardia sp.]